MTLDAQPLARPVVAADPPSRSLSVRALPVRRFVTVLGVVAALVLGYASIQAAAAWTAASAPLTVAPVSVASLQDRLALEQARSGDLTAQLDSLSTQSAEMTAALEAAQAQIATDADHAKTLSKDLKAAKKKLAKLEASIAKAKHAATQRSVVVTKTVAASSTHHDDDDEDDDDDDDEDHGDD
jgi:septal ring factor EnvC (AmiA/AmiB activator)